MPFERFSINSTSFTFFLCNFLVAFIAIGQILTYSYRIPGRHKSRRQTNLTYTCEASCDAQFSQDFEENFNRSYNTAFFDFPIDPLLTTSFEVFQNFCRLVSERDICLRRECLISTPRKSPQTHICQENRPQFESALHCLNTTNQRFHYQSSCSRAAKRSIDIDEQLLETRGFSEKEVELYHEQDLRCRFQACILEARNKLITQLCPEGKEDVLKTIKNYYLSDLNMDLEEFGAKSGSSRHFPRFCTSLISNLNNATLYTEPINESTPQFNDTLQILRTAINETDISLEIPTKINLLDATF